MVWFRANSLIQIQPDRMTGDHTLAGRTEPARTILLNEGAVTMKNIMLAFALAMLIAPLRKLSN